MTSCSGILLIDKVAGPTSFDVVKRVRGVLGKKIKVGHAGTLDPFATGLLVIMVGQGTKLSPYLMSGIKKYYGTMVLGVETDSFDNTGKVVKETDVGAISADHIEKVFALFKGKLQQKPPAFSAVKKDGIRAYKLARNGQFVDLKERDIEIFSFSITDINLPSVSFELVCSAGTYVRSIASDVGKHLGTGAHLVMLRRLSSGAFSVDNALSSANITDDIEKTIIGLDDALAWMPGVNIDPNLALRIRNGYQPSASELKVDSQGNSFIKASCAGELIAIFKSYSTGDKNYENLRIDCVFM